MGDTVWHEVDGGELIVVGFRDEMEDGEVMIDVEGEWSCVRQFSVTHRKPDTQEAIDADCALQPVEYCEKHGIEVENKYKRGQVKCAHLLERQRKLMGGE